MSSYTVSLASKIIFFNLSALYNLRAVRALLIDFRNFDGYAWNYVKRSNEQDQNIFKKKENKLKFCLKMRISLAKIFFSKSSKQSTITVYPQWDI